MIGLYFFILCVAGLIAYGIYELYQHMQRKGAGEMLAKPGEESFKLNQVLSIVYNHAMAGSGKAVSQNKVSKVLLMEETDLRPKELKKLIRKLSGKNLLKETMDTVTITPFGVQFYKTFSHDKLNLGS